MKRNMGHIDRFARVLVAVAIAALYFSGYVTGTLAYILLAVGGIFLVTSLIGFCPLYTLLGINSCKNKPSNKIY